MTLTPLNGQLNPLTATIRRIVTAYILRDTFSVDQSAPSPSPMNCDGVGSWIVYNAADVSKSNGELVIARAAGSPNAYSGVVSTATIQRSPGVVAYSQTRRTGNTTHAVVRLSTSSSVASNTANIESVLFYANNYNVRSGNSSPLIVAVSPNTNYWVAVLLRASGAFYFIKGGAFSVWTLLFITNELTTSDLYLSHSIYESGVTAYWGETIVQQLPAPFDNEASWRTSQLLNPAVGDTTTHAPNCAFELSLVYTSGTAVLRFREESASSFWIVQLNSTSCVLYEYNGGYISRGTYVHPSVITAGESARIVITADGSIYRGFIRRSTYSVMWTYTDPGNRGINAMTARIQSLGGWILSELNCWPSRPELPI